MGLNDSNWKPGSTYQNTACSVSTVPRDHGVNSANLKLEFQFTYFSLTISYQLLNLKLSFKHGY